VIAVREIEELVERAGGRSHDAVAVGLLAGGDRSFVNRRRAGTGVDEHTLFEIGSVTKPFTGVLLAEAHLRSEVDLHRPISDYLPAERLPRWRDRAPTLEELATHRASLPNAPSGMDRQELAFMLGLRKTDPWNALDEERFRALVRKSAGRRPPGRKFRYSSLGFGLLGQALEVASGMSYEDLLRARVTGPLGLDATSLSPQPHRERLQGRSWRGHPRPPLRDLISAAGGLWSNASDLLALLATSLEPPAEPPGPALRLARAPRVKVARKVLIGLGWFIVEPRKKPPVIWHTGGTWGFRSFAAMVPDEGSAVVVLANTARSVDRLGYQILDRLRG
jgi:D-alanyl-D-alanine-carboxypeptidase/D-alanyl-D-alanine-endopeptidase